MARIEITITAKSPLSLGTIKAYGGTLIETGLHVAGGQLRGALGALKSFASQAEQSELDQLLGVPGQPGIKFPNCYLTNEKPSFPLPMTAQTCKLEGGFREDKKHGVADTLLMQLAYDQVARDGERWCIPLPFQYKCQYKSPKGDCRSRTEEFNRIVEYRDNGKYAASNPSLHRQTRVAVNRARLTAEDGQLYSVQAIDEGSQFVGVIEVDGERAELASTWLEKITRIGGRTSRGFGAVTVSAKDSPAYDDLRDRVEAFNKKYREFEADLRAIADNPKPADTRTLFTVNLRSDAVLREALGLPTLQLNLRDALDELATGEERQVLDAIEPKPFAHFVQPQSVSGWQTAWQLPKEVLLSARMGGLYIFAADIGEDEGKRQALCTLLEKLQVAGIGEMRQDGYGQIIICDPFHLEVEPV
ncbi:MAG: CRISPR-associated RAMP protein Csx10 [Acidobacteriota bacterium]|nr:CRISPR-associated RAMP protein Csx10 [Acidobacteriota bacterium]